MTYTIREALDGDLPLRGAWGVEFDSVTAPITREEAWGPPVSSTDQIELMTDSDGSPHEIHCYRFRHPDCPDAEVINMVHVPSTGLVGIAWGGDSDWGDPSTLEEALRAWLVQEGMSGG